MGNHKLTIGIIARSVEHQHALSQVIIKSHLTLGPRHLLDELSNQLTDEGVDAWLVGVDISKLHSDVIDLWLQELSVPVIFDDSHIPTRGEEGYGAWEKRIKEKITSVSGVINLQQSPQHKLEQVWVLAASTGGPAAVQTFLSQLPPDLGVAFIYVQHIDKDFHETLSQAVSKNSHYPVYLAEHGAVLADNAVALITPDQWVDVIENGTFYNHGESWPGSFSPSVDQVVAKVARTYSTRSGVIIFTGMGDDGVRGSRLIKQQGGQVWAQAVESCTIASMPSAVIEAGIVSHTGTPQALAESFSQYIKHRQNR